MSSIYEVVDVSKLFHSVGSAKKSDLWKKAASLAKANSEDFHVESFLIASGDEGLPFLSGDVMENKFNMSIVPVRVI